MPQTLNLSTCPRFHSELPSRAPAQLTQPYRANLQPCLGPWALGPAALSPASLSSPLGPTLGAAQLLNFCITPLVLYWGDPRHLVNRCGLLAEGKME